MTRSQLSAKQPMDLIPMNTVILVYLIKDSLLYILQGIEI